jgi:transketolase
MAPLGHIAARLHAIGNQARQAIYKEPYRPMILVCAHAGLKTGEDGPTHADPQALQLLQEHFPQGTIYTLTPWDPQEIWTLMTTSLAHRPAIIAPFVTRPNEIVPDRTKLGLAPATASRTGIYLLRAAEDVKAPSIVLQGSGVTMTFVNEVLPELIQEGLDINVYYVACAEIFNSLPEAEQKRIFPESQAQKAMGITGFTLPTMYKWIRSDFGRSMTLHPYQQGHYLGSGQADMVLAEAGLDAKGQYDGVKHFLDKSANN